jgi:hypothetical protein
VPPCARYLALCYVLHSPRGLRRWCSRHACRTRADDPILILPHGQSRCAPMKPSCTAPEHAPERQPCRGYRAGASSRFTLPFHPPVLAASPAEFPAASTHFACVGPLHALHCSPSRPTDCSFVPYTSTCSVVPISLPVSSRRHVYPAPAPAHPLFREFYIVQHCHCNCTPAASASYRQSLRLRLVVYHPRLHDYLCIP